LETQKHRINLALGLILAAIIGVSLLAFVFAQPQGISGTEAASNPSACNVGDWLTQAVEDTNGNILLTCATVNQNKEVVSSLPPCAAGKFITSVNESAAGGLSFTCITDADFTINSVQTTITGTTAGTAVCSQPIQTATFKEALCFLNGYENVSGTPQTYTYPTAFVNVPTMQAGPTANSLLRNERPIPAPKTGVWCSAYGAAPTAVTPTVYFGCNTTVSNTNLQQVIWTPPEQGTLENLQVVCLGTCTAGVGNSYTISIGPLACSFSGLGTGCTDYVHTFNANFNFFYYTTVSSTGTPLPNNFLISFEVVPADTSSLQDSTTSMKLPYAMVAAYTGWIMTTGY
jgi:hypothetical protein